MNTYDYYLYIEKDNKKNTYSTIYLYSVDKKTIYFFSNKFIYDKRIKEFNISGLVILEVENYESFLNYVGDFKTSILFND